MQEVKLGKPLQKYMKLKWKLKLSMNMKLFLYVSHPIEKIRAGT
jgi:hypothetical protein